MIIHDIVHGTHKMHIVHVHLDHAVQIIYIIHCSLIAIFHIKWFVNFSDYSHRRPLNEMRLMICTVCL